MAAVTLLLYQSIGDAYLLFVVLTGVVAIALSLYAVGRAMVAGIGGARSGVGVAWRYGLANVARRGRDSQPLEVYWGSDGRDGRLLQHGSVPGDTARQAEFDGIDGLDAAVQNGAPWDTDGVFLFVDGAIAYATVREVYDRLIEDFPNVYVFL